jgi:thioredoxin reductase
MLDSGNTAYAVYAIYKNSKPVSIVLYNSDYYTSGARTAQTYTIQGLSGTTVTAKRLTAASATSRQDLGSTPTFGGQVFLDKTCEIGCDPVLEHTAVAGGTATFKVSASEALLISLN